MICMRDGSATVKHQRLRPHHNGCQVLSIVKLGGPMDKYLTQAHMDEIGILTVLESFTMEIESSLISNRLTSLYKTTNTCTDPVCGIYNLNITYRVSYGFQKCSSNE